MEVFLLYGLSRRAFDLIKITLSMLIEMKRDFGKKKKRKRSFRNGSDHLITLSRLGQMGRKQTRTGDFTLRRLLFVFTDTAESFMKAN